MFFQNTVVGQTQDRHSHSKKGRNWEKRTEWWVQRVVGTPLCNPMDCSQPGSSVPGTVLARIPEWDAMPSKGVYKMALNNTEPHSETMIMVLTIFHAI